MNITLYGKVGCHLCDDARAVLDELAAEVAFELREVDILSDPRLYERYKYRIPVITIGGREVLEGRFELADLRAAAGV
ncbi:MAG TPA: glutaredoxin family protein [Ktedonobacterales bacterium]|nr:glutaredoxin family protein [Ktedonobacterales bacterium]